jgi:hypothetical protein
MRIDLMASNGVDAPRGSREGFGSGDEPGGSQRAAKRRALYFRRTETGSRENAAMRLADMLPIRRLWKQVEVPVDANVDLSAATRLRASARPSDS